MAHKDEPSSAPQPDRWYNLTLGSSFIPESSNKFCTLRYEFKPASIDKTKAGTMHKNKENRVSVEFQNNQLGKPKVVFEGSSEDYKDNDAVLFFDGEAFRLERLHRAVKQLRHCRKPGESAAAPSPAALERMSPVGKSAKLSLQTAKISFPSVPVEVERIDIGKPEIPGPKNASKSIMERPDPPNVSIASPVPKNDEYQEHQDIDIDDIFGGVSPDNGDAAEVKSSPDIDMIPQHRNDTDDEIAVDVSGDEADKGPNAAEALRAQVNAGDRDKQSSSSSSSSSGSGSSGSGSGSSSSSSSSSDSDEDSVTSI